MTGALMDSVLVLIAAPGSRAITPQLVEHVRGHGAGVPRWLSPDEALEVDSFSGIAAFLEGLQGHLIDHAIVPVQNRRKHLLLADMDSTMIRQECIDELGAAAGV